MHRDPSPVPYLLSTYKSLATARPRAFGIISQLACTSLSISESAEAFQTLWLNPPPLSQILSAPRLLVANRNVVGVVFKFVER